MYRRKENGLIKRTKKIVQKKDEISLEKNHDT
jgi:hypothetical protein